MWIGHLCEGGKRTRMELSWACTPAAEPVPMRKSQEQPKATKSQSSRETEKKKNKKSGVADAEQENTSPSMDGARRQKSCKRVASSQAQPQLRHHLSCYSIIIIIFYRSTNWCVQDTSQLFLRRKLCSTLILLCNHCFKTHHLHQGASPHPGMLGCILISPNASASAYDWTLG